MKNAILCSFATMVVLLSGQAKAASSASCTVSIVKENRVELEVIKTPNLPPYISFKIPTCSFSSSDGKVKLDTAVLRGMLAATVYYENKKILWVTSNLRQETRYRLDSGGFLPSGEEISVRCTAYVDPNDISQVPKCE